MNPGGATFIAIQTRADLDVGIAGISLQRIEKHFGNGMFEGRAIARQHDWLLALL